MIFKCLFVFYLSFETAFGIDFSTNCGRSLVQRQNWRIVGGTRAAKGELPWQVQLNRLYKDVGTGEVMVEMCGGSIINDKWVLTAAHCVTGSFDVNEYSIKMGVTDLTNGEGYKALVSKVIHHDRFETNETGLVLNDIALVKIDGVIDFTRHKDLEPICLPTTDTKLTNECIVSGFGLLSYDQNTRSGTQSTTLQKVSEPLVENSKCVSVYPHFDSGQHVCAGGSGHGFCKGDSGGPLQCKGSDGKFYEVGVVSFTIPCGVPDYPDVFTRVATYMEWIEKTISQN